MKLRVLSIAVLLMASGMASAAPQLQTCQPMEVTHNGGAGLGYSLSCEAGAWNLNYKGSVPAGSSSVLAQYRLSVSHPDGTSFVHSRTARLPEPSLLGQMLVREAVVLDDGNLALRECPEIGCTLYRPLGGDSKLAKASITVPAETARLLAERKQLADQVAAQTTQITALQAREARLSEELVASRQALTTATERHKAELLELTDQQSADMAGLQSAHDAQLASTSELWKSGSQDQLEAERRQLTQVSTDLNAKIDSLAAELGSVRQELQAARAELATANEKLASEHTARQDFQLMQADNERESQALAQSTAATAAANAELEQSLAATQASLAQAQESIRALSSAMAETDAELVDMTAQRNAALMDVKEIGQATLRVIDEYDVLKADLEQSEASKAVAQKDAADTFTKLEAAKLTQELSTQAANVAHLEVDSLNLQVRGLTAELNKALELLTIAKKEQAASQALIDRYEAEKAATTAELTDQGNLKSQLEDAEKTIAELRSEAAAQFNQSGEAVNRLNDQIEACKAAVTALEANGHAVFEDLKAAQARLADKPLCVTAEEPN